MSTIKVDTIQDTSGNEQFTAKAWVNFNGTGTVAIRDSGNVSSITDHAVGGFSINLANAFAAAEASACSAVGFGSYGYTGSTPTSYAYQQAGQRTTTLIAYSCYISGFADPAYGSVICVG